MIGFLTTCIASIVYGAFVMVLMLWLLFPVDFVRQWIPQYTQTIVPNWLVTLEDLDLNFPDKIHVSQFKAVARQQEQEVFLITQATLQPEIVSLFQSQPTAHFSGTAYEGTFRGTVTKSSSGDRWRIEGHAERIEAAMIGVISAYLNRSITGSLSVSYSGALSFIRPSVLDGDGSIVLNNGTIGLQREIVGHELIPFSQINCSFDWQGNKVTIDQGQIESELFTARFDGNIELAERIEQSLVSFSGVLRPKDMFFRHVANKTTLRSIRTQLDEEEFSFYVSGMVTSPGISFGEYSALLNSLVVE